MEGILLTVALFPGKIILLAVLGLFLWSPEYLGYGLEVMLTGVISLIFWLHVLRLAFLRLKRLFGIYE